SGNGTPAQTDMSDDGRNGTPEVSECGETPAGRPADEGSTPPHPPIQSYVPAELRIDDDIRMEIHQRPNEAPSLLGGQTTATPTVAAMRPAGTASAPPPPLSPAPATVAAMTTAPSAASATGTATTIAIDDIPLASHTISDTLSGNWIQETPAVPSADNGTSQPDTAPIQTVSPTLPIEDIPLADGTPPTDAPDTALPDAVTTAPSAPESDAIGFTIERPAAPETAETAETASRQPAHIGLDTPYDPTLELRDYRFPTLDLLEDFGTQETQVQEEELLSNKNRIVETLQNYGIKIDTIKATIGPTVTLYEIVPAAGIRISKIKNLEDDIALSLAALGIRIIAPIPGKGTIGIEVPNQHKQIVPMRDMICCQKFQNEDYALPIALGKTISNEAFVTDLAKMPHLLVAGATGQGKSVGLNAIIASLLYKKHPAELKFVMVDPKKVELSLFNKIERHYLAKLPDAEEAIITDTRKVVRTLNSLCIEMDTRYDLLKNAGAKNIKEYNKKFIARRLNPENGHRFLPYIVL
ncbi:MAG: hypothetical protein K2O01_06535, partial [Bacteroidales bacterium]|nr:hypothetical protein [Bacteroidales bacterium]